MTLKMTATVHNFFTRSPRCPVAYNMSNKATIKCYSFKFLFLRNFLQLVACVVDDINEFSLFHLFLHLLATLHVVPIVRLTLPLQLNNADDCVIYCKITKLSYITSIHAYLNNVHDWSHASLTELNLNKCKAMRISPTKQPAHPTY